MKLIFEQSSVILINKLLAIFPLSNESQGRKQNWFWIEDAITHDLPGMALLQDKKIKVSYSRVAQNNVRNTVFIL
jgi:hypothetical protein